MRIARAVLFSLALCACARNAILELEIDLPPQPDGAPSLTAVVQASTRADFGEDWSALPIETGVSLASSCTRADPPLPCNERMLDPECSAIASIVSNSEDSPLYVRVRFCEDESCAAANDESAVEQRIEIEHPFYVGRYTQARSCIEEVPLATDPDPLVIERCQVRCRDGNAAQHCRLDGTHFCE
jgi:hypothetical protein